MKLIDEKLGGTTPLEIIIKFPMKKEEEKTEEEDDWGEGDENDENIGLQKIK